MKIVCVECDNNDLLGNVFVKPDSSIHNIEQHLYIPNFTNNILFHFGFTIKLEKPGKYIEEKFSFKYYSKIGIGGILRANDLEISLKERNLFKDKAYNFDSSTFIGDFYQKNNISCEDEFSLRLNSNEKKTYTINLDLINKALEETSKYFSYKTGDVLICYFPDAFELEKGDDLSVNFKEKDVLFVNVK